MTEENSQHTEAPRYAYKLVVIGDNDSMNCFKEVNGISEVNKLWNSSEPFILRRRLFPIIPKILKISRQHLKIYCEQNSPDEPRSFLAEDISSNGTLLNNKLMEKGKKIPLKSGDEINLIYLQENDSTIHFGLKFIAFDPKTAPLATPFSQFQKKRMKARLSEPSPRKKQKVEKVTGRREATAASSSDFPFLSPPGKMVAKRGETKQPKSQAWTPEEERRLWEMMRKTEAHHSHWKDIAVFFNNRSPDAVRNKFKKMSEMREEMEKKFASTKSSPNPPSSHQKKEQHKKSKTGSDVAEEKSKRSSTDETIPTDDEDRRRKLWTSEELKALEKLVIEMQPESEEKWAAIAKQLRRTVKSVKHKVNDHNMRALITNS